MEQYKIVQANNPVAAMPLAVKGSGYWQQTISVAPLIVFRMVFGVMLFGSILRFWAKGWIEELYIRPSFFFTYYGLEWIKPLGFYTYALFAVCAIAALLVAIGLFYRVAAILLFCSFTYIELIDKTTYLNHYYFVSLICFLLIFLPANASFSIDACIGVPHLPRRGQAMNATPDKRSFTHVPRFTIDIVRVMMAILYVYAGLAKVNSDWLLQAQPLRTWLPAKNNIWLIGPLFNHVWVAYLFSWFGCLYDLTIPLWLSLKKTRLWAFGAVIVFHVLTAILFPIGMFPYIMIVSALIFFPPSFHETIIRRLRSVIRLPKAGHHGNAVFTYSPKTNRWLKPALILFVAIQLLMPFRYLLYPGELFWTEEGYRFSWRVMLMEKTGYTVFSVHEAQSGRHEQVDNRQYLTLLQEKQMSFQPDMILQFAHHIAEAYRNKGWKEPAVYAESYVTLNGRPGRLFINPLVNLAAEKESFKSKTWVLPFHDDIQGF